MGKIKVTKDGPYEVSGGVPLLEEEIVCDESGDPLNWKKTKDFPTKPEYLLCRCGKSKNKPYCDGSHIKGEFDGEEVADPTRIFFDMAQTYEGPLVDLHDAEELCSGAGFCYRSGGTWDLTEYNDKISKELAIQQSCDCPSGRLVIEDKKKGVIETEFEEVISIVQEPEIGMSGPLWVKGKIEIESASGSQYEKRNRVTLCRCGKSNNNPFCDRTHHQIEFNDSE